MSSLAVGWRLPEVPDGQRLRAACILDGFIASLLSFRRQLHDPEVFPGHTGVSQFDRDEQMWPIDPPLPEQVCDLARVPASQQDSPVQKRCTLDVIRPDEASEEWPEEGQEDQDRVVFDPFADFPRSDHYPEYVSGPAGVKGKCVTPGCRSCLVRPIQDETCRVCKNGRRRL